MMNLLSIVLLLWSPDEGRYISIEHTAHDEAFSFPGAAAPRRGGVTSPPVSRDRSFDGRGNLRTLVGTSQRAKAKAKAKAKAPNSSNGSPKELGEP